MFNVNYKMFAQFYEQKKMIKIAKDAITEKS